MKKVTFKNINVEFDNETAKVSATIDESTFDDQELKSIVGAILQNLTGVSDMHGNPIIDNILINKKNISGHQKTN